MKKIGIEAEYLLGDTDINDVLQLELPGISSEFFRFMVEVVTEVCATPTEAVDMLRHRVDLLLANKVALGRYASFVANERGVTMEDVTKDTEYYRWVFYDACQRLRCDPYDLHYVGIHINISDSLMDEDAFIRATNVLRCFNFLFPLLTANSPFQDGVPCGMLSRRVASYPNRYDVPLWRNEKEFRRWIVREEAAMRIYPGKARCWMPVCPRLVDNDTTQPFERIELRSLDSGIGVSWELIEGCCELALRLTMHSFEMRSYPAMLQEIEPNDIMTARLGREATVSLRGKNFKVTDVARWWCNGIPVLEEILSEGSPAELGLRRFYDEGKIPF